MLILRPFQPNDWQVLSQYQYPGMSESDCQKMIAEFNTSTHDGRFFKMLAVQAGDTVVGYVSLFEQDADSVSEGVEIYPPYRRQGYAWVAVSQLLSIAGSLGYQVVTAQIRKDNDASLALHNKLGFQVVGEFVNRRGRPVYSLSLAIT